MLQAIGIKIIHGCNVLGEKWLCLCSVVIIFYLKCLTFVSETSEHSSHSQIVFIYFLSSFFKYIFIIYKILFHS